MEIMANKQIDKYNAIQKLWKALNILLWILKDLKLLTGLRELTISYEKAIQSICNFYTFLF